MKKYKSKHKWLIQTLLLILIISNFSISFAYWASHVEGSLIDSNPTVQIGQWDFISPSDVEAIMNYRSYYAETLALTIENVEVSDKPAIEEALHAYGLLSERAKEELDVEKTILLSLLSEIIAFEHSEFIDFENDVHDSLYTGTLEMNDRTWYGNNIAISNSTSYDVWRDTRSLGLKMGSYFESRDVFMNGIDKITLYHGALNYNNGASYQFKIEYQLQSSPGVWVTLEEGGTPLLINVISGNPMTYVEIEMNLTEAFNIRFTPVISNSTDYINLDDIRIYEHVVSSSLEVETYLSMYRGVLELTTTSIEISDMEALQSALTSYQLLSSEAKNELNSEKALLDSLKETLDLKIQLLEATNQVALAEQTYDDTDLFDAQTLVTLLPDSIDKQLLQDRINLLQMIKSEVSNYQTTYSDVLSITIEDVMVSDKVAIENALAAYQDLSMSAKSILNLEYTHLLNLLSLINDQIPVSEQVDEFRLTYASVLALTVNSVSIFDLSNIEEAITSYDILSSAAKNELNSEKVLLDNLILKIHVLIATEAVEIAEDSYLQSDLDDAQVLVSLLASSIDKTELQQRLNTLQNNITSIITFRTTYPETLALTIENVEVSDKPAIEEALYAYGLLSERAKEELDVEKTILLSLLSEIIAFEHSEFIDFENDVHDSLYTGTLEMNDRTWYGNNIAISNSTSYDVWRDTRSLGLKMGSYFESRDVFMNGIDKITLYHGALNYNNGASYQFKIEYQLQSSPGVWVTLEEGGTPLLINVISGNPMTYVEIEMNLTEAFNIRFTPVISNSTDYINLDDIRIYEHVVSSSLEVETYLSMYRGVLELTTTSIEISDMEALQSALTSYQLLSSEAKNELNSEKALLDSLKETLDLKIQLLEATNQVALAEQTYDDTDLFDAQTLVTLLPDSIDKQLLQDRINLLQMIKSEVSNYQTTYSDVLSITIEDVMVSDKVAIENALAAYQDLSMSAKSILNLEYTHLLNLLSLINDQIPVSEQVDEFRLTYASVLALTVNSVSIFDLSNIEEAITSYDILSSAAKNELISEKVLLDNLILKIHVLIATEAVEIAEDSYLQSDLDDAQVLVSLLASSIDKTELQQRLNTLQNIINSHAANDVDYLINEIPVSGEISLEDQLQIQEARIAFSALTQAQKELVVNESVLISAELEIVQLQVATQAVILAETTKLQQDLDSAQSLVSELPNGTQKQTLQARIDTIQDIINVELAKTLINNYFQANSVVVSRLNNATTIKQTAFLNKANETINGLGVSITIQNTVENNRNRSTYTIRISLNEAFEVFTVVVNFTR